MKEILHFQTSGIILRVIPFFIFIMMLQPANIFAQSWNALCTGTTNGNIYAAVVLNDQLYVGGDFTMICGVSANRVARWNGTSWFAMGTGMDNTVRALLVMGSNIVAGGDFTSPANYIAQWNGSTWGPFAIGMNGAVHALTLGFSATYLCAGGGFTTAGGNNASRVARWTGSGWTAMGSGTNDTVYALLPSPFAPSTEIIVAGKFTATGGMTTVNRIGRWTTGGYTAGLGTGIGNGAVYALAQYGATPYLYVGGNFTLIGGNTVNRIAYWNGTSWFAMGAGANNTVYSLNVSARVPPASSMLVLGGLFTNVGGISANSIATWNGTTWGTLGTGMSGGSPTNVWSVKDFRAVLAAFGSFTGAGSAAATNVALWGVTPAAPAVVSPPCNTGGYDPNNLTLDWTDVTNAWRYRVQVANNPNFNPILIDNSDIAVSQYTIGTGILQYNTTYYWRVSASNAIGSSNFSAICWFTTAPVGITINSNEIPKEFKLEQNYPNPFNPSTKIRFALPELPISGGSFVKLRVYDAAGKEILQPVNMEYKPGVYEVTIDGSELPNGIYFYSLVVDSFGEAAEFKAVSKMVLLK
jgi:hypothetical protein